MTDKKSDQSSASKNINWKTYFTGLLTAGTLALFGGIIDFQSIKAEVKSNKKAITQVKEDQEKDREILKTIGIIICMKSTRDELPQEARKTCLKVLK